MGKSAGTDTTTQKSEPWGPQQSYLRDIFSQAQGLNRSGGPQYFPDSMVTPFSDQTETALGMQENRALNGSPVIDSMKNYIQGSLNGGAPAGNPVGFLQNQMGTNPSLANMSGYADAADPSQAREQLGQFNGGQLGGMSLGGARDYAGGTNNFDSTINGDYLNSNPYLDATFDHAANRVTDQFNKSVMPGINSSFARSNRTGSGIQKELQTDAAGEVAESLAGLSANIYGNNYQQERGRQLQAQGMQAQDDLSRTGLGSNLYLGDTGLANNLYSGDENRALQAAGTSLQDNLGRLGMGGQLWDNAQGRRLQASGQAGNIYGMGLDNQRYAASLAPSAAGQDYLDISKMGQVGGAVDQQGQAYRNDNINRWNYEQMAPYDALQRYMGAIQGHYGGTSTTTAPSQRGSGLSGLLGGLGMAASFIPGIGPAIGAGTSAVGGGGGAGVGGWSNWLG